MFLIGKKLTWSLIDIAILTLIGTLSGVAVTWLLAYTSPARVVVEHPDQSAPDHIFTFENRQLVATSPAAQNALNMEDVSHDAFGQLIKGLETIFPQISQKVALAEERREKIALSDVVTDGPVQFLADFSAPQTVISVSGVAAPLSPKAIVDQKLHVAMQTELEMLRNTVATSPTPIWHETPNGTINWVNKAYLSTLEAQGDNDVEAWPPKRLFDPAPLVKPGEAAKTTEISYKVDGQPDKWYEISSYDLNDGSLHFANDATSAVLAEERRRMFMQTLTRTFADLPIGLAVFDRSRRLMIFNPVLSDLTTLDPSWLVARPTLADVLNMLRERRIAPERRDFGSWRQKIRDLEHMAVNGTYSETWTQPAGQTYRITGKPYPDGAIAFIIEDITAELTLTRKFRQELDLNQAVFDSIGSAMVVFNQDGTIRSTNKAYAHLWGIDPNDTPAHTNISDALSVWKANAGESSIPELIQGYILNPGQTDEINEVIALDDDQELTCHTSRLGGGNTLVRFNGAEFRQELPPDDQEAAMAG